MAEIEQGGPAFPHDKYMKSGDQWGTYAHGGMSLRDYFAGQALAGLIANVPTDRAAEISYRVADFMIAARGVK